MMPCSGGGRCGVFKSRCAIGVDRIVNERFIWVGGKYIMSMHRQACGCIGSVVSNCLRIRTQEHMGAGYHEAFGVFSRFTMKVW